ncbi:hypothetical protein QWY84_19200 [Aquisalimonas lutea]|uniref:hypothetical protein n=1 Tax=Aquisalimonas lutea TaxID=1327750 RepID=UPI0025B44140|nr:hypothetical protein [Aquisalimonas lutea]MDN3519739.1 hypothetical protein [Aquisalimonas lutea]
MTKQISVTPCSALSRLLESRPTRPDINRSTHIELGYTDVPVSRIPENDAINRMAARYEWTLSQGFPLLDEEAWMLLLNSEISRSEFALDELDGFASRVMDDLGFEADPRDVELYFNQKGTTRMGTGSRAMEQIRELTAVQRVFVAEAIERICGDTSDHKSPRTVIAHLAGRSPDAVFCNDREVASDASPAG